MRHIFGGVAEHSFGKGPLEPVRAAVSLGDVDAQELVQELRQADLLSHANQRCGCGGVEDRLRDHAVGHVQADLVLVDRVCDLQGLRRNEDIQ